MGTSILQGFLGFSSLSMSQIGSYALLLALALSVYSFLRGMLELLGRSRVPSASGKRRGCTGIATFAAVLSAIVLVPLENLEMSEQMRIILL
jgi:hypothetical protein